MRRPWEEAEDFPTRALGWLAVLGGVILFGMMMLTTVDVIGRYFFNAPVRGSAEATELLLAAAVFAGLPVAAARGEHIRIDILEHVLGERARRIQAVIGSVMAAAVMSVVAWRLALRAIELAGYNERSSHLSFPVAWLAGFLAATSVIATGAFLWHAWRSRRGQD